MFINKGDTTTTLAKITRMSVSHRSAIGGVQPQGHRTAELRSIAMHRLIAERLDADVLDKARKRIGGWLSGDGPVDRRWALQWEELLSLPVGELREKLVEDSEGMRDLRQSTPFAGVLREDERRTILEEVR